MQKPPYCIRLIPYVLNGAILHLYYLMYSKYSDRLLLAFLLHQAKQKIVYWPHVYRKGEMGFLAAISHHMYRKLSLVFNPPRMQPDIHIVPST